MRVSYVLNIKHKNSLKQVEVKIIKLKSFGDEELLDVLEATANSKLEYSELITSNFIYKYKKVKNFYRIVKKIILNKILISYVS